MDKNSSSNSFGAQTFNENAKTTTNDHIVGIDCEVKNCQYNQNKYCTAKQIQVGPSFAAVVGDTLCNTFKQS